MKNRKQMPNWESVSRQLTAWHRENRRQLPWRRDRDPYHIWISEIMLQQTRLEAVIPYYERFLRELPGIKDLAEAEEDRLLKLWEGLGYYSRARNLKRTAIILMEQYAGSFPREEKELLSLPGIGPYTAGAILSLAFGEPVPAVDGNVLRIYARLVAFSDSVDMPESKKRITKELKSAYSFGDPAMLTEGFMELGQRVCVPNGEPACHLCPLREDCRAVAEGTWRAYPVRSPKRERKREKKIIAVFLCGGRVAIQKRQEKGLLAGLWEFPEVTGSEKKEKPENAAIRFAEERGLQVAEPLMKTTYNHIFTHKEWEMEAVFLRCREAGGPFIWALPRELEGIYALPSAFRSFREEAVGLVAENPSI